MVYTLRKDDSRSDSLMSLPLIIISGELHGSYWGISKYNLSGASFICTLEHMSPLSPARFTMTSKALVCPALAPPEAKPPYQYGYRCLPFYDNDLRASGEASLPERWDEYCASSPVLAP